MLSAAVEVDLAGWAPGRRQGEVAKPIVQFCKIFYTAGMEKDATPDECVGLERASVWESGGVDERLLDTLMGRPNPEEERGRVCLA